MIDIFGQLRMKNEKGNDYIPGDFGLRLGYPSDVEKQQWMQLAEIKNGRLAMIAVHWDQGFLYSLPGPVPVQSAAFDS